MTTEQLLAYLAVGGAVITVLGGGGVLGWFWRKQPERKAERERRRAADEAIIGRAPVLDEAGGVMEEARPGLVHLQRQDSARLRKVEEAIVEFRHLAGITTELQGEVGRLAHRVGLLEDQRVETIVAAAERAATAASATEALRLIRDRDTEDGETTGPELEQ